MKSLTKHLEDLTEKSQKLMRDYEHLIPKDDWGYPSMPNPRPKPIWPDSDRDYERQKEDLVNSFAYHQAKEDLKAAEVEIRKLRAEVNRLKAYEIEARILRILCIVGMEWRRLESEHLRYLIKVIRKSSTANVDLAEMMEAEIAARELLPEVKD